jgi:CRISPR/Cas system-associated exonuclease Cas4 (RecB family)
VISFLKEIADNYASDPKLDECTFIFPNRRAALYFQYYLSQSLSKPQWAPAIYSIEEFFRSQSALKEPDRLTLIHRLYHTYGEVLGLSEPFDRFFFWGDMLLRDFDEIDKYMINGPQLFKDLSKIKELDETFDYLKEEQKQFLQNFWLSFEEKPSTTREQFLRLWRKLPKVYGEYTKALRKEGIGYEGMIHREVADRIQKKGLEVKADQIVFAGFNALTKAEAMLITRAVEQGAKVHWDEDAYYSLNPIQEAGQFMRHYREHPLLKKTFSQVPAQNFLRAKKNITLTGVPQKIGQAKLAGERVKEILSKLPKGNLAMELAKTVIVLPDESMLLPVLHSLPKELEDINVTMGFPLRETPLFNLLDLVIEMQCKKRKAGFSHREVNALLGHSYIDALAGKEAEGKYEDIVNRNRVFVPEKELKGEAGIFDLLFRDVEARNATGYLLELVEYLGASFSDRQSFDREYAFHFYQHISRLHTIFSESTAVPEWRGFQKLFRQVVSAQKIPFSGEPLRGLQIMGVLETRNLDFDNVIMLSLNEGMLPVANRQGTYIPNAIRKAYGLPTNEYNDAIYAYLFYRLLQRTEKIDFYYNTEPDIIGNGEMSRYLQQLLLESKLPVKRHILHTPVHVQLARTIVIQKTEEVLSQLEKYVVQGEDAPSRLSPSTMNDYIECPLRFYLKNVVRLTEAEEVEEDLDARVFGNILHDTIHWFYEELKGRRNGVVEADDIEEASTRIDLLIDRAFREMYHMGENDEVVYEGRRVVVRETVRVFLQKILHIDKAYAPFEILMLEEPFSHAVPLPNQKVVKVGGNIDRADRKNGVVRVIDYKTGKDELNFESIESLFSRDKKHNKAAFQTFLYAFVYQLRNPGGTEAIKPGLFNRKSLFEDEFKFGHSMGKTRKEMIHDARPLLIDYATQLHLLIEEIFNPEIPFTQTADEKKCQFCSYKTMCRR